LQGNARRFWALCSERGTVMLRSIMMIDIQVPHSINSSVVKKQQSRLTLQKETKVVEGKMYILPDFSLKTTLIYIFFFG
jgi:hypothetical protein